MQKFTSTHLLVVKILQRIIGSDSHPNMPLIGFVSVGSVYILLRLHSFFMLDGWVQVGPDLSWEGDSGHASSCQAISFLPARSWGCWQESPISRKAYIHRDFSLHLSGVQSATTVWNTLYHRRWSIVLDAPHSCLEPWNFHGAGDHPNCHCWTCDATLGWLKHHWGGQQYAWG